MFFVSHEGTKVIFFATRVWKGFFVRYGGTDDILFAATKARRLFYFKSRGKEMFHVK